MQYIIFINNARINKFKLKFIMFFKFLYYGCNFCLGGLFTHMETFCAPVVTPLRIFNLFISIFKLDKCELLIFCIAFCLHAITMQYKHKVTKPQHWFKIGKQYNYLIKCIWDIILGNSINVRKHKFKKF